MHKSFTKQISIFFLLSCLVYGQNIVKLYEQEGLSFRGLSALNDSVVWVSGNKGTVLRTEDGGKTFHNISPKGYEKHDFRDIEAINDSTAIIMGIASPGVLLLTNDNGNSWEEIYRDEHPDVFMDAMVIFDAIVDIGFMVIGDAVEDNKMYFVGGNRDEIQKISGSYLPDLVEGEAFFASSGTNIASRYDSESFFVSGGLKSRLFVSFLDDNEYWKYELPMLQGKESTGANSITFDEESKLGMIVGGDFLQPDLVEGNSTMFKIVGDSIEFTKPKRPPNGYRSCVDFIGEEFGELYGIGKRNVLISCGLNGVDMSFDYGEDWFPISKESYHVCLKARESNAVFLAGRDGKIGKLYTENFNLREAIEKNNEEEEIKESNDNK